MEATTEAPKVCENCESYPATHRHLFAHGVFMCRADICCNCANCDGECEDMSASSDGMLQDRKAEWLGGYPF